jgi:hypothetical protein
LNERSDVPKGLAERWVESEQILPLLDGLDEVSLDQRQTCVEVINQFRRDHGLLPIVVCSRTSDYDAVGTKLRLRNAVVLQPLTRVQIQDCLSRFEEHSQALRATLKGDPALWDVLETPLMLWVAILAYQGAPLEFSAEATLEQRRRHLFRKFIEAMLERRPVGAAYTREESLSWLSWLGAELARKLQTVFYLEDLRGEWLSTGSQRWLVRAGTVLASGLSGGLIGILVAGMFLTLLVTPILGPALRRWLDIGGFVVIVRLNPWIKWGLINGAPLGIIIGLIGSVTELRPVERLRIGLAGLTARVGKAARVGAGVGFSFGLIFSLIIFVVFPFFAQRLRGSGMNLSISLSDALIGALENGLTFGLIIGLIKLVSIEAVETRRSPNQGTRDSMKAGLAGLIGGVPIGSLFFVLNGGLSIGPVIGPGWRFLRVAGGMEYIVILGLLLGLFGGGLFALRHFVTRLVLWMTRSGPLNYVRFLDSAVDLLFLRKVGGGYIFSHRGLLEYFASLAEPHGPAR